MKRGLLIGVGTLGSLGAVFAITPPQFGSTASTGSALGGATASSTPTPSPTKTATAPAPTKSSTPKATPTPSATQTQAPTTGVSGTFTGASFPADERGRVWGDVHVTVTLKNDKIVSINGSQSPASRGYLAFNQIDPYVVSQKITIATIKSTAATSLPYVSGASYSSMAYWQSLKSALQQAGI